MGAEILDLDALRPEKRVLKVDGKEIDVSVVPFEVYLKVASNVDRINALQKGVVVAEDGSVETDGAVIEDAIELMYEIVRMVCARAGGDDAAWLDELDAAQSIRLLPFILKPLFKRVEASKNDLAAAFG